MESEEGFIFIDKPADISSFDVIRRLRKITGMRKMGHAGTLDPFATGLLIVAIGRRFTKQLNLWLKKDKEYLATIRLGYKSTTGGPKGEISRFNISHNPKNEDVERALEKFTGSITQVPPAFSAIKISGRPAYKLAREGKKVEIEPRDVTIHDLELLKYSYPDVIFRVHVSSGTYIRTLAEDIGESLSTGAYVVKLRRTSIDCISVDEAVSLEELNSENWREFLRDKAI